MEIERKYLVKYMPEAMIGVQVEQIEQSYVSTSPVIRARRIRTEEKETFILTVKGKGMLVREEHELEMDRAAYDKLVAKRDGIILKKDRYLIPLDGELTAELDVYKAPYEGLYTVEVEFPSVEAMERFQAPDWFGEDVSEDGRYKNSYLCTNINQESER